MPVCAVALGLVKCGCGGFAPNHRTLQPGERHEADIVDELADATDADPMDIQRVLWAIQERYTLTPKG